ncbi:MAG: hypothetical protein PH343_08460 [Nitrospira sp.]|nr:hypothetical protein [Nitrospira sp.]
MKTVIYLLVLLVMGISIIIAQTIPEKEKQSEKENVKEVKEKIDIYMKNIRESKPHIKFNIDEYILSIDDKLALDSLKLYEDDTSKDVRDKAYFLGHRVAKSSSITRIRQEMTSRLVKGLNSDELLLWQHTGKWLLDYTNADFTASTKQNIHNLFVKFAKDCHGTAPDMRAYDIVLIAGTANIIEEMDNFNKLLFDETNWKNTSWYIAVGWAARLARARIGSQLDMDRCIKLVDSEPNITKRANPLLQQLAYIRQPAVIESLKKHLNSDEQLPLPNNAEIKQISSRNYAAYAAAALAEMLSDFPIKDETKKICFSYTEEDIKLIRKWMSEQKEFKIIR